MRGWEWDWGLDPWWSPERACSTRISRGCFPHPSVGVRRDGDARFCCPARPWLSLSCAGDQRSSVVNESSSLLGGSPRRQCGRKGSPYHTGQLHPAVRVADLLQHINQMKTAEGYGFKQEYEVGTACASTSGGVGGRMDRGDTDRLCVPGEDAPGLELWAGIVSMGGVLSLDPMAGADSSGLFVSLNRSLR